MKMNPVVHFELPGEDMQRMQKFYQTTFGWQTKEMGAEFGKYVTANTSEMNEDGFPKERGRINGGFFPRQADAKVPTMVIAVDDIYEHMKKVEEAGGKITGGGFKAGEPDDISGVGLYIAFEDTEGNRIAMLQPKGMWWS